MRGGEEAVLVHLQQVIVVVELLVERSAEQRGKVVAHRVAERVGLREAVLAPSPARAREGFPEPRIVHGHAGHVGLAEAGAV